MSPATWTDAVIEDVTALGQQGVLTGPFGATLGKDDFEPSGIPVLTIGCITDGGVTLDKAKFVNSGKAGELSAYALDQGDLLFSRMASVGRVGLVKKDLAGALFNYHIIRLRLNSQIVNPVFAMYYLRGSASVREYLDKVARGATRDGVNTSLLTALPITIPPPAEQRRIVAKIEALSARSRRARADLDRVATLVVRAKEAVLVAAFRGELTKGWRAKNPHVETAEKLIAKTKEPDQSRGGREATTDVKPGLAALSVNDPGASVPPGWAWIRLRRIARQETGHTPSRSRPEYWDGGVPWIGIRDAGAHHGPTINETLQTISDAGLANSSARLLPAGTVCLSRTASVGYVTIMGRSMATSQDFATWTCTVAIDPEYLMFALMAEGENIRGFGEGTTHTTIYFPEIRALHVCLAPKEEQIEIVRRVKIMLATVERAAEDARKGLALLDRLDQSILGKAFRGELVSQDPVDEPASVVLDRIRAERAQTDAPKRRARAR
jgi:type I restriction enzyme S subunit